MSTAFQMTAYVTSTPLLMALVIFSQKVLSQFVSKHMVKDIGLIFTNKAGRSTALTRIYG